MITTVLFGIPGAPFAAVIMGLLMYLNIELGDPSLFYDPQIFNSMLLGFIGGTIIVAVIILALLRPICYISKVPMRVFFPFLFVLLLWSCTQYTGGWEDYSIFCVLGNRICYTQVGDFKTSPITIFHFVREVRTLSIQLLTRYIL